MKKWFGILVIWCSCLCPLRKRESDSWEDEWRAFGFWEIPAEASDCSWPSELDELLYHSPMQWHRPLIERAEREMFQAYISKSTAIFFKLLVFSLFFVKKKLQSLGVESIWNYSQCLNNHIIPCLSSNKVENSLLQKGFSYYCYCRCF